MSYYFFSLEQLTVHPGCWSRNCFSIASLSSPQFFISEEPEPVHTAVQVTHSCLSFLHEKVVAAQTSKPKIIDRVFLFFIKKL
ncbi:hypothetical protein CHU_1946 [Cytophaga hutchinsonii ATCC 33406]|uniref:Uncharacterized protein n=1 Tax=Cytophaga hutchinsonii (strain ATCC 33406 / DSM 1761 / CIP 103989 / NBRC 15051 / NCIMB 9469 / D465) TaxID=269798 RepID=A0A6N4SS27_CYTH3|nr:hypothetical protein CHU_1946 [Cytophaga hutchinsonii ATCC 33406]